jgi:hypothetical protein
MTLSLTAECYNYKCHLCRVSHKTLYADCHFAECRYADCHYAEYRYAECNYGERRGSTPDHLLTFNEL